jgi:prophage DNA circulation protein
MQAINRPYFTALQTASWRNIPFGVNGSQLKTGRKTALHEYPFRDEVWVEDLGRQGRRISFNGFLVEDGAYLQAAGVSGAGDVIAQRADMIAACETAGEGSLVHPSLGSLTVSLLDFECEERSERGRVFELRFTFIESAQPEFPSLGYATQAATGLSALTAFAKGAQDWINDVTGVLSTPPIVGEIERNAQGFVNEATAIVQRATSLVAMVVTLPGNFGRFVGQFVATVDSSLTTIEGLIGAGTAAREAVQTAGSALTAAAAASDWQGMANATQALVSAVQHANPGPHTAIGSLLMLQAATVTQPRATHDLTSANTASVNLFRRTVVTAIGQETASYALTSVDDAEQLRSTVCAALDTEITTAGDAGEDASYNALRDLEAAVVLDVTTRGQSMSAMQAVHTSQPVPLLVLAERLYQDVTRYDGLLQQAKPVHPAFPPTTFRAPLT